MNTANQFFDLMKSDVGYLIFFGVAIGLFTIAMATHKVVPPVAYDGTDMQEPKKRFAAFMFIASIVLAGIGFYLYSGH